MNSASRPGVDPYETIVDLATGGAIGGAAMRCLRGTRWCVKRRWQRQQRHHVWDG